MANTPPGALFAGILRAPMRAYLHRILSGARTHDYTRIVEPAAGPFTACQLAAAAGYSTDQLEASDVSFFSAVLGRAINGLPLDDLEIQATGVEFDTSDPAAALWALVYLRSVNKTTGAPRGGGWYYWRDLQVDLVRRRDEHLAAINKTIGAARKLAGFKYSDRDMFEHIEATRDDPNAVLVLYPPTYRGGYEKIEETGGRLVWKQPGYSLFDPKTDVARLGDLMATSRALWVMIIEAEPNDLTMPAVFAHGLVRRAKGVQARTMNAYLVSNRPDELEEYSDPAASHWSPELPKPTLPTLPAAHVVKRTSRCHVAAIGEAEYWRTLWLHNFRTLSRSVGAGLFVDGYLAGILGYDFETRATTAQLTYHVGVPGVPGPRWQRAVIRAALTREALKTVLGDLRAASIEEVRTTMFSPHPASMAARGLLQLLERKPDKRRGFHLQYGSPVSEVSVQEAWRRSWDDDDRWRKRRGDAEAT